MTDRKALAGTAAQQIRLLLGKIESAARAGVDWIQIREQELSGRELTELVRESCRRVPARCRILVNGRLDVAYTAGAGGVHLGERSMSVADARRFWWKRNRSGDFLIGASVHSLEAAQAAETEGADYLIFGPVHPTPSKAQFGPPQGLTKLSDVCERTKIPVIAIGGITLESVRDCVGAGAAGVAAIRLFQDAQDLEAVVRGLRSNR